MDIDLINRMRINFYLSNYKKVLDVWKEVFSKGIVISEETKSEFWSIIQRTILKFFKNEENLYNENAEYFKICENSIELYLNYMAPLVSDISIENCNKLFIEIQNWNDNYEDDLDYQIIYNHICFNLKYFDKLIKINKKYKYSHLEYNIMIMRAFLNNNQLSEAKDKLEEIKNFEQQDDILIELAEIEYLIYIRDFKLALEILEELRSKYGDYPKIWNLISTCFIGINNYEKASEILVKLNQILRETIKDNTELELCIKNLITINILKGNEQIPTKKLLKDLKEITNDEDFLISKIADINQVL